MTRKKIIGDIKIWKKSPLEHFDIYINPKNILEWYFLLKAPEWSYYKGGYYIGRITHNEEYPLKSPKYEMLTPSGRFVVGDYICMSNTSFHEDEWNPAWNILTLLNGFLSVMLDETEKGVGHSPGVPIEDRKMFAKKSVQFNIDNYFDIFVKFKRFVDSEGNIKKNTNNNKI